MLRKEEDAVAKKQAQGGQVDRCATHDLPGLIAVVDRKRQRQQVVIDEVAQVLLDVDRHRAGDEAAEVHDGEAPDCEAENQDDQVAQLVRIAWTHRLVDDATCGPRDRDREDLADHGQHNRRPQCQTMRAHQAYATTHRGPEGLAQFGARGQFERVLMHRAVRGYLHDSTTRRSRGFPAELHLTGLLHPTPPAPSAQPDARQLAQTKVRLNGLGGGLILLFIDE